MIVINSVMILGGTHAEHMPQVKSRPVKDLEKDDFPDPIFFPGFFYQ